MIYVIADTHDSFFWLPEDCTKLIHAGDYGHQGLVFSGDSVLVRGNHDDDESGKDFGFSCQGILVDNLWITHEPAFTLPLGAHYNVHGHLHENEYEDYGYVRKPFHVRLLPNKPYRLDELIPRH